MIAAQDECRRGTLIVVVGPSGAGKDTIIDYARVRLAGDPSVMFVRRVVTRPSRPAAENHASMAPDHFAAAEREGAFAFTWRAHGLSYAFPAAMKEHLDAGGVAVANGSRATLPRLGARFPSLLVVSLVVSRAQLAARLAARGRESAQEIERRLDRADRYIVDARNCLTIRNDGPPEDAGERLLACIRDSCAGLDDPLGMRVVGS